MVTHDHRAPGLRLDPARLPCSWLSCQSLRLVCPGTGAVCPFSVSPQLMLSPLSPAQEPSVPVSVPVASLAVTQQAP